MIMVQPMGNRVLLEMVSEDSIKKIGGIFIPDAAQEKPMEMKVVMLGTGGLDKKGKKFKFFVKPGNTVLCSKYGDELLI